MGQVQILTNNHRSVQQSWRFPRKDVWTLCQSRHSTCLHLWNFPCYKRLLERTSYCHWGDVHPPPEGWDQGQRQKIMLWRPQIWPFGLTRHSWQGYAHTKESRGHSGPHSPKNSQKLRQFIGIFNFYRDIWQKRQIRMERRASKLFWCYQTCDRTWHIVGLPGLQCSVWNPYWCFQTINLRSHIPFQFMKDEQCPTKLHHNR